MVKPTEDRASSRGPEPARVKINKPWDKAVKDALTKKRPEEGWPKPEKKKDRGA